MYNKHMEENKCLKCNKIFKSYKSMNKKFCSKICYHSYYKGKPLVGDRLEKQRELALKMIKVRLENTDINKKWKDKMRIVMTGSKNHRWLSDRSKIVNQDERNSYKYIKWREKVLLRDKNKCRINNHDCVDGLQVHHILSWREYPELHYKVNNGITLCRAHHPRVRAEEKRLIPTFMELVSVLKV